LKRAHGTSAYAWDWDDDGDLDLLLGDYNNGQLFLRRNDGKPGAPGFVATNEPVLAGDRPLNVGKLSTPRLVDWDRDGLLDLVCGSMGDGYGGGAGGAVHLFRNTGRKGSPRFAAPVILVPPSRKESRDPPARPDSGLYMDLADCDADGDLDLLVGGYSHLAGKNDSDSRLPAVWLYENRSAAAPAAGGAAARTR
jgi:hypothetical protein